MIKEVTRFQTSDGQLFSHLASAEYHQVQITNAENCTRLLDAGESVADILRSVDRDVPDPILEQITKDSEMVISYWQCKDTAGYKPVRFNDDGRLYVFGDAGSWSGSYGGNVSIQDLVRYAKTRGSILSPNSTLGEE